MSRLIRDHLQIRVDVARLAHHGPGMVAIKASGVDAFLARPQPEIFAVLIYGPDAGLVAERAAALAAKALEGSDDPFSLVRLEGDDISGDPGRLSDEARTIALFGGKRAIRVRVGGRTLVPALEGLLGGPQPESLTILEAGDLKKNAPLRTLCEKSPHAAALPCYTDEAGAREKLIDEEMRAAGLTISSEARALLSAHLGPDRLAAREEVRKLCLYAMGGGRIEPEDVSAIVASEGEVGMDEAVDAAFAGRGAETEATLRALRSSGVPASVVVGAALRHALSLHRMRGDVDNGRTARAVVEGAAPPVHFRRRAAVERALSQWTSLRLVEATKRLADAIATGRKSAAVGEATAERTMLAIAQEASRAGR